MAGLGVWLERVPGLVHRKRSAGIYPLPSVGQKGQKVEQECRAWVRHKPDFACFSHPVLTDNNACGVCACGVTSGGIKENGVYLERYCMNV